MTLPTKAALKNKDQQRPYLVMFMRFFFLILFIKTYVVGTHLNCIDKSMQFKWVTTTYALIKKRQKVHWLQFEDCGIT